MFTAIQSYMEKTVWFDANGCGAVWWGWGWGVVGRGAVFTVYPTLHEGDITECRQLAFKLILHATRFSLDKHLAICV